jgi:hypothetical protein
MIAASRNTTLLTGLAWSTVERTSHGENGVLYGQPRMFSPEIAGIMGAASSAVA